MQLHCSVRRMAAVVLFVSTASWAIEDLDDISLEELLSVSLKTTLASKSEESVLSTSGTVYVIGKAEIARYGWQTLAEILNSLASMDNFWVGGSHWASQRANTTTLGGTTLLIDGHDILTLTDAHTRSSNALSMPASVIKRVEVLQGPASSLYGGGAHKGAINVVTIIGDAAGENISSLEYVRGENNVQRVGGSFSTRFGPVGAGLSATYYRTDNTFRGLPQFWADAERFQRDPFVNAFRDPDLAHFYRPFEELRLHAQAQYKWVSAALIVTKGDYQFPFGSISDMDTRRSVVPENTTVGRITAEGPLFAGLTGLLEYQGRLVDARYSWPTVRNNDATSYENSALDIIAVSVPRSSHRLRAELKHEWRDLNRLLVGYDFRDTTGGFFVDINTVFPPREERFTSPVFVGRGDKFHQHHHSVFVQDTVRLLSDRLKLTVGGMFTHQSYVQNSVVARAAAVYQLPSMAFKLIYSRAYVPPDPDIVVLSPRAVSPEIADMVELAHNLELKLESGFVISNVVALYGIRTSNLIHIAVENGELAFPNYGSVTDYGAEDQLKLGYRWFSGLLGVRYATKNVSPDMEALEVFPGILKDVPALRVKVGLSSQWEFITGSLFVDISSSVNHEVLTLADPSVTEIHTIPAYAVANLYLAFGPFKLSGLKATAGLYVGNILNTTYYTPFPNQVNLVQILQPGRFFRANFSVEL